MTSIFRFLSAAGIIGLIAWTSFSQGKEGSVGPTRQPGDRQAQSILGEWEYHRFILDGESHPPPNPDLIIRYVFSEGGQSRLSWRRLSEGSLCDRKGVFIFKDQRLMEEVTWVNPKNAVECGRDPDMQLGKRTVTKAYLLGGEFHTVIPFGDKDLIYVWKPITPEGGLERAKNL